MADKTVYVENSGYVGDLEGKLTDVITFMSQKLQLVPEIYRDTARIEFEIYSCGYDDVDKSYSIYYTRPETIEEETKREAEQAARAKMYEKQERDQYERLKAKFERNKGE